MVYSRGNSPMRRSRSPAPRHYQRHSRSPIDRRGGGREDREPYRRYSRSPRRDERYDRRRSPPRRGYNNGGGSRYGGGEERRYGGERRGGAFERRNYKDGRENPLPSSCLGIFGMSSRTSEKDLTRLFERYGRVKSVQIVFDRNTGKSRGYGFVYFEKTSEATNAKEDMKDKEIDSVQVRIDYSVTKEGRKANEGGSSVPPSRRRSRSR
uniref:RRM domain-containing protein n=1 Tax=Rhabditophanes sp. KR3021 TaxID=114890 RepID=A0AC35TPW2_9BILA